MPLPLRQPRVQDQLPRGGQSLPHILRRGHPGRAVSVAEAPIVGLPRPQHRRRRLPAEERDVDGRGRGRHDRDGGRAGESRLVLQERRE